MIKQKNIVPVCDFLSPSVYVVGHRLMVGWLSRLGEDFFEALYRFIRQACLVVDGRGEERETQNRYLLSC